MGACRGRKAGMRQGTLERGVIVVSCVCEYRTRAGVEYGTSLGIHAVEGGAYVSATQPLHACPQVQM